MNRINNIASIMTGSMMIDWLREARSRKNRARSHRNPQRRQGFRTAGLDGKTTTSEMTDAIVAQLKN